MCPDLPYRPRPPAARMPTRLPLSSLATRNPVSLLIAAALFASAAHAQPLLVRTLADFPGSEARAQLGQAVAALGDVNGDGFADFAVGEPFWGPVTADSTGRVFVYFGGRRLFDHPDLVLVGDSRGGQFGFAISSVGDLNGDGYADFAVGAPSYVFPNPVTQGSGRVYLFRGSTLPSAQPWITLNAPVLERNTGVRGFGASMAALGDLNGDGFSDWVVGIDRTPSSLLGGGAVLYMGGDPPPTVPQAFLFNPSSGRPRVFACGDMDGDHVADVAMSYPTAINNQSGMALFLSVLSGPLIRASSSVARGSGQGFGTSAVALGDVNGDGVDDLLIGVPRPAGGSNLNVWAGSRTLTFGLAPLTVSEAVADSFGSALAVDRFDGGSARVIVVGACGADFSGNGSGALYFYQLSSTLQVTLLAAAHGDTADYFGASMANVGDVDGNGIPDLLVGSPMRSAVATQAGRAQL